MSSMKLILGDSLEELKELPDNSIDSIVTDPPYGLNFMGKTWDYDVPSVEIWKECLRVLKPGGYLLSFGGTRTYHRLVVNIEDAGFEIRDMIAWVYGSGFPKSHNIGKAVDKLQGNERESVGISKDGSGAQPNKLNNHAKGDTGIGYMDGSGKEFQVTKGTSEWEGWGTALKPALEPITVARKPINGTVANNVLKWGPGGINIDKCRIPINPAIDDSRLGGKGSWKTDKMAKDIYVGGWSGNTISSSVDGRWPANFIHDGSHEVIELFPYTDAGTAARFFYCAKASKKERNEGLDINKFSKTIGHNRFDQCDTCGNYILQNPDRPSACKCENPIRKDNTIKGNFHPTVKPLKLMQYLVNLVTPKKGTVLDPFMGSGSTGIAVLKEQFDFIGIEIDPEYFKIASARLAKYQQLNKFFG